MRIEISIEIARARAHGFAYTPFRPFYDEHERGGLVRCRCGRPSLAISYCVVLPGVVVACRECLQKDRESQARRAAGQS